METLIINDREQGPRLNCLKGEQKNTCSLMSPVASFLQVLMTGTQTCSCATPTLASLMASA